MTPHEVALRYSKALFNICSDKEVMENFAKNPRTLLNALKKVPRWKYFFSMPQISLKDKEEVLAKALGNDADPQLLKFLLYVLQKGRITFLPDIIKEFERKTLDAIGIKKAVAITASIIPYASEQILIQKLEAHFEKKILLKEKLDPALQGGVLLIIDNQMIDHSIKNRLKNLKESLLV